MGNVWLYSSMSESTEITGIPISVKFFSTLKNLTGCEMIDITVPAGKTLLEVLGGIQEQFFLPKNARLLNPSNSELEVGLICLVNEADYHISGGMKYKFKKPSKITLISSLHGG